jgi:hypothetical protein
LDGVFKKDFAVYLKNPFVFIKEKNIMHGAESTKLPLTP